MQKYKRRTFLKAMGASGLAFSLSALPVRPSLAAELSANHHFVFCYFGGGWDILMSLDPRGPEFGRRPGLDVDYSDFADESPFVPLASEPDYAFGPLFHELSDPDYRAMFERGCIVRGISTGTLSHDVGRRYFMTGRTAEPRSSIPSIMVSQLLEDDMTSLQSKVIHNLVVRMEAFASEDIAPGASPFRVDSEQDLERLLRRESSSSFEEQLRREIRAHRTTHLDPQDPASLDRHELMARVRGAQEEVEELLDLNLNEFFTQQAMKELDIDGYEPKFNMKRAGERHAAIAYQALTQQLAHCVSVQIASGLDTHVGETPQRDQRDRQLQGWRAVAKLVRSLEKTPYAGEIGTSWLDHTTIVCFSEFARSAKLNVSNGRDHNLTNAMFMIGELAPTRKVIGGTFVDTLNAAYTDLTTGEVVGEGAANAKILTPELVYKALLSKAGYDPTALTNSADDLSIFGV